MEREMWKTPENLSEIECDQTQFICPNCGSTNCFDVVEVEPANDASVWSSILSRMTCSSCLRIVPAHLGLRLKSRPLDEVRKEWTKVFRDAPPGGSSIPPCLFKPNDSFAPTVLVPGWRVLASYRLQAGGDASALLKPGFAYALLGDDLLKLVPVEAGGGNDVPQRNADAPGDRHDV
jgi:hypothetical protein